MTDRMSLRDLLRRGVAESGLSIEELAKRSGVNRATIYRALSDDPKHAPSSRTLEKISRVLDEVLGRPSVRMAIGPSGVSFDAGWSRRTSSDQASESATAVYSLCEAIVVMLETAIASHIGFTLDEKMRLFSELRDPVLKIRLGEGLQILSPAAAENAQVLLELAAYIQSQGDRLARDDMEARRIASRFKLSDGSPLEAQEPLIVAIGMGSIILQRLADRGDYEKYLSASGRPN